MYFESKWQLIQLRRKIGQGTFLISAVAETVGKLAENYRNKSSCQVAPDQGWQRGLRQKNLV